MPRCVLQRWHISIYGRVQGVGLRPFVYNLAQQFQCSGWVRNQAGAVIVELQADVASLQHVYDCLQTSPPPASRIVAIEFCRIPIKTSEVGFEIQQSQLATVEHKGPNESSMEVQRQINFDGPASSRGIAVVTPDLPCCIDCLREMQDPSNRRHLYPFINCTQCGPRFTIQRMLPYDREQTTMQRFTMCDACRNEYELPSDRRYHAQPNACHRCGPMLWYRSAVESSPSDARKSAPLHSTDTCVNGTDKLNQNAGQFSSTDQVLTNILEVRRIVYEGKIVAIKGVGGFHLVCDARNPAAVALLRQRKRRPSKPFAVMAADIETAENLVHCDAKARDLLQCPVRPIVLARKRAGCLPECVAPWNPLLGVMLPYAPLHHLLLCPGDVWVMTSGNIADEPLVIENDKAVAKLSQLVDGFLLHDRPIYHACEDSIIRCHSNETIPIRIGRGIAPLSIELEQPTECVLAVGGDFKSTMCLAFDQQVVMSPHLGEINSRDAWLAMDKAGRRLLDLFGVTPAAIAADLHPDYHTAAWARRMAEQLAVPLIGVQHHHAHAASLVAEYKSRQNSVGNSPWQFPARPGHTTTPEAAFEKQNLSSDHPVVVCVFDGTGYGLDGAIWGGEFLILEGSHIKRAGHVSYTNLPSGAEALRTPAKIALAYLFAAGLPWDSGLECVQYLSSTAKDLLKNQLQRGINTYPTSSVGRLFDAVAALLGCRQSCDFEGQAAIALETLAASLDLPPDTKIAAYSTLWDRGELPVFRVEALFQAIYGDLMAGVDKALIAWRFHQTLADTILDFCQTLRTENCVNSPTGQQYNTVGLSGGVFQNALLLSLVKQRLQAHQFRVLSHTVVPPNDGGLALGQAMLAIQRLRG